MTAVLLWLALAVSQAGEEWQERLAAGDFRGSWSLAAGLADPVRRARAQTEIRYQAGDPAGALAAAEAGLTHAPEELELLFYASGASLWLQEAALARTYAARLSKALEQTRLAPDARESWNATAREFAQQAAALVSKETHRDRAVSVARAVSLLGLGAALAALFFVSRAQGKSSSPVS